MEFYGLDLFDNYSGNPRYSRPASIHEIYSYTDTIVILICLAGSARFKVKSKEYVITRNSFLAICPEIQFSFIESSGDLKVDIFKFTESNLDKTAQGLIKIYFYKILYENPLHTMSREKTEICHNIHQYLKTFLYKKGSRFHRQIVRNYLSILFYEACDIMLGNPASLESFSDRKKNELAAKFIVLVEKNIRMHRKPSFYAQCLNISPKYLSTLVKDATGRTPTEWIDGYTLTEAKSMLKDTGNSIQSISYDLGFATPSHFAKFFRDNTGMSPREFRKQ